MPSLQSIVALSASIWRSSSPWSPKWAEAFHEAIFKMTGERLFSYRIAVTKLKGDGGSWQLDPTVAANLGDSTLGFLTLSDMWSEVLKGVTTAPASSEIGRMAQLPKAAGLTQA
jgi:hypothetical protein